MTANTEGAPEYVTAAVELSVSGKRLRAEMSVPIGLTRPIKLLPLFQSLADSFVNLAVGTAEAEGGKVSCKKGCGACCRQLVPITEVEARRLRDLVNGMPEPRRSQIRARFETAWRCLREAGLLERLQAPEQVTREERSALGLEYFYQGLACPFLEEESCSIYADRPIACREYLVTSPAENCSKPTAETVKCVKISARVSNAVARLGSSQGANPVSWVPLILALRWADTHPDESLPRPGTELVQELFSRLAGKDIA